MKDGQKIYLRGDSGRGNEVIKFLEDLDGKNSNNLKGDGECSYYFINPNGVIISTAISGGYLLPFIKEFYKEVKLSRWKPKYKERYYRINWRGAVVNDIWHDTQDERLCYEFGNCFETHDKAKAASYKVQEILNK